MKNLQYKPCHTDPRAYNEASLLVWETEKTIARLKPVMTQPMHELAFEKVRQAIEHYEQEGEVALETPTFLDRGVGAQMDSKTFNSLVGRKNFTIEQLRSIEKQLVSMESLQIQPATIAWPDKSKETTVGQIMVPNDSGWKNAEPIEMRIGIYDGLTAGDPGVDVQDWGWPADERETGCSTALITSWCTRCALIAWGNAYWSTGSDLLRTLDIENGINGRHGIKRTMSPHNTVVFGRKHWNKALLLKNQINEGLVEQYSFEKDPAQMVETSGIIALMSLRNGNDSGYLAEGGRVIADLKAAKIFSNLEAAKKEITALTKKSARLPIDFEKTVFFEVETKVKSYIPNPGTTEGLAGKVMSWIKKTTLEKMSPQNKKGREDKNSNLPRM